MSTLVNKLVGKDPAEEEERKKEHVHHHHRHHKDRHRKPSGKIVQDEAPANTVPQLERKVLTLRDHLEQDLGEKDALLKLIISGIQNLNDSLDGERNERCDDVDELHSLCKKLRQALDQEADERYGVDQSLQAFKDHSDYADLELKGDIELLQEFQRDTIEDKKIIMGAIMELEEKLNEVRSSHGHQIDDILINQGQIRKSIEEQIQIIHRIQLSDFENATLKITDIQSKLQEQIKTQAEDFRELTVEANKSMARQNKEMHVIKRQMEDRIDELSSTVDKKETGLSIKLQETKEKFAKIETKFGEVTKEFTSVSGQVDTAIDQIHSTRARAEEATDIQKNRFEYFDMFMQSLKQSQATIDSRIGFLYTIVNELRWRERAETARTNRVARQHSSSNVVQGDDVRSTKSGKSVTYSHASLDYVEIDNLTQAVNDIEMEMKAKIEVLTDNLEQHRKETLHAISRARDKSLSSTTAVDKLQTVIERMNEKFSDITRLENELGVVKKKSNHIEQKVDHLEDISEAASKKVDVLSRKLWDVYDSDMNINQFIDFHLKEDKERLWRLEYEANHLKHMTIGEDIDEDTLPLHLQNTTVLGEVDHVKKNISRCLVKSEQLVDDVTNIAKQNDMIRNDMRDLKLLCDYLSSKNDETQRYCRALRKHLEFTNRKLDAYESGGKIPFRIFRSESQIYDFEEDLPPLEKKKKKSPVESPRPSTPIFKLFIKNKERQEHTQSPTVREVEALNLKSTQRVPSPDIIPAIPTKGKNKPSSKKKKAPNPPQPPKEKVTSAKPADKKSPTPPPRTPKSSGGGFFNFFGGSRKPEPGNKEQEEEAQLPEIEEPRPKGLFERIFGGNDDPPKPSPPPKHMGHIKKKRLNSGKATASHNRESSGPHVNVPLGETDGKLEDHISSERLDSAKISVERGAIAEEKLRKEKESAERLKALREREIVEREAVERAVEARRKEEDRRKRRASIDAKLEREKRLVEATERAREARANEKVIKGELPTLESWREEELLRKQSYERRKKFQEEQARLAREYMVEEAREAREKLEREEAERRAAKEREQINSLDHELEKPRHISREHFSEVSPTTAEVQKQEISEEDESEEESEESDEEESEYEETVEETATEEVVSAVPEPPAHELHAEEEDPWEFDIERRSQTSRSSRQNSVTSSRKLKKRPSVFNRK
ncbi:hypothetical protein ACHWQZ_G002048 [Mnemiopsis leidyi]